MISEMAKPKEKAWSDGVFYKNIRMLSGNLKESEEIAEKFKGQVAAGSVAAASIMDFVRKKDGRDRL